MKDNSFITEYMYQYYDEVEPRVFYRGIFQPGELEAKGIQEKGKYTGVAVELIQPKEGEQNVKRYTITDDLDTIDDLQASDNFIIISPISYAGKSRKSENARFIYALAIDLDGVDDQQHLTDLFHQMKNDVLPRPTYIVTSGTGVHLYYVFHKAIPCFKNVVQEMGQLKNALTRRIWNKYVTTEYKKVQYQSLFQGFRMVGGVTKDGKRTRAFEVGDRVDVEYLNRFIAPEKQVKSLVYKSNLTLDQAKEKYPEWYEERVVKGRKRNTWTCKRDLYEWWKDRIKGEATEGHRYFCIMCLAIYAKKCGIDYDELSKDAFSLVERFDVLSTDDDNRFTREDVLAGLELYNDGYITFPIHSIVDATNIPIERNRRNYQPQAFHLEEARFHKELMKKHGRQFRNPEGRPKGSGTKQDIVETWQTEHPDGRKAECIRDLGIDRKTVSKYWKS